MTKKSNKIAALDTEYAKKKYAELESNTDSSTNETDQSTSSTTAK